MHHQPLPKSDQRIETLKLNIYFNYYESICVIWKIYQHGNLKHSVTDLCIMRHVSSKKIPCAERLRAAVIKTCSPQQYIPLTDHKWTESAKLSTFLFIPPSFSLPPGPELLHLVSKLRMCFLGTVLRRSHAVFTTPLTREEKGRPGSSEEATNTIQDAA